MHYYAKLIYIIYLGRKIQDGSKEQDKESFSLVLIYWVWKAQRDVKQLGTRYREKILKGSLLSKLIP